MLAAAMITVKEMRRVPLGVAPPESVTIRDRVERLLEPGDPAVLVFYGEPTEFCCEGTRIFYEEIRDDARRLVALLEGAHPHLSVIVVGSTGSKVREYHAPYDPASIVAYVDELR